MIENEQQYRVTKAQIQRFEETLVNFTNDAEEKRQENPLLFEVQVSALKSQLADLQEELAEYEVQKSYLDNKTFKSLIQGIIDKITFTNFISTSLIIGGLIFLAYFNSIGYVPELEINSAPTLLGASAITGVIIYILISLALIYPGIFYALNSHLAGKLLVNDKQKLLFNSKHKIKGFSRLTFATSIIFFNFFVLFQDNKWIVGKILFVVVSLIIEFLIAKSFYKKGIKFYEFLILPAIAYIVFLALTFSIIMLIYFVFGNQAGGINLYVKENLANVAYLFLIFSFVNKLASSEADLGKNPSSFAKYLALSLIAFILVTIQFGVGAVIPGKIFNMYGWGNIQNASLIVNYEGCQILKKIDIKIIDEKCSKAKDFYQIDDLQILSTIGKNYFLRYPKVHSTYDSKPIPQNNSSKSKNNSKSISQKNSPKPKNISKANVTKSEKFVDFTFPASSIKSWSRKKDR